MVACRGMDLSWELEWLMAEVGANKASSQFSSSLLMHRYGPNSLQATCLANQAPRNLAGHSLTGELSRSR